MSRLARSILFPLTALLTCAPVGRAQSDPPPFAAVALMAGPQGFARPPVTSGMLGGYVYAPWRGVLLGAQGGGAVIRTGGARALYGIGTVGVPSTRSTRWQSYPFVGIGAGILRARHERDVVDPVFAVGLGADVGIGESGILTMGSRVGYITRSAADDRSIAYLSLSLGVGMRGPVIP